MLNWEEETFSPDYLKSRPKRQLQKQDQKQEVGGMHGSVLDAQMWGRATIQTPLSYLPGFLRVLFGFTMLYMKYKQYKECSC